MVDHNNKNKESSSTSVPQDDDDDDTKATESSVDPQYPSQETREHQKEKGKAPQVQLTKIKRKLAPVSSSGLELNNDGDYSSGDEYGRVRLSKRMPINKGALRDSESARRFFKGTGRASQVPHPTVRSPAIQRNYETKNPSEENDSRILRDLTKYLPLYKAAMEGDWRRAKELFEGDSNLMTARITTFSGTVLHVAAVGGNSMFMTELVKLLSPEALEIQNSLGETALHTAAIAGVTKAAEAMVNKNPNLPHIPNESGWIPLLYAANYVSSSSSNEQKEMVEYLYKVTNKDDHPTPFSGLLGAKLICTVSAAGFFDIALSLVQQFPKLATEKDGSGTCVLEVMAERPYAFLSGSQLKPWQRWIYPFIPVELADQFHHVVKRDVEDPLESSGNLPARGSDPITKFLSVIHLIQVFQWMNKRVWEGIRQIVPWFNQVYKQKLMNQQALALIKCICAQISQKNSSEILEFFQNSVILIEATRFGIVELIVECTQTFPDLVWFRMNKKTILEIAIEQRREKIFNLICGVNLHKKRLASSIDESGNTILHLAAKLAPSPQLNSVSGAALQMQRELQWFKAVENIGLQRDKLARNKDKKTAQVLFTEEHKDLVEKGEKWMKDTAQSCMVVATLIATVVFAAAFTVPGGNDSSNNNNNGIPIFLNKTSFMVFAIADALALFSSTTSVLMFLSILTARYAEEDFLTSLPKKLIIGLATLFFSIATMLIAFTAALTIVLGHKLAWVPIPIGLVASVPVALFSFLQFPLFVEMILSTYLPTIFLNK